ncbi:MAG TPA: serine/threonine-protein kinase, partial [Candidatus Eisenbacteria bacterium]|nr:serine/threonine-protein kinase [Candidatus Eisenbacteria bacterium]
SLLASHDAAGEFLEPGSLPIEMPAVSLPEAPKPGQSVGSWKVVRPLAEGGMGVVYLVEREDGQYQQRGALKFIRHGLATDEMVRRFRRERQILASLDHPNMARLLDGGTTSEGLPWLVMEYVDGVPLYEWCSENAPTLRARLRLFLTLCGAVEAAHRRLVLHRDIKPGNVLVTSDGAPRLLDFGVAKIFSQEGIAPEPDLTTLHAPLTPEYASPEQLRGAEVTTSSDVYLLGVLLYELVTGVRPYPTRAEGAAELVRTVLERDPVRPSTAVVETGTAKGATRGATTSVAAAPETSTRSLPRPPTGGPAALGRALSGDLDNIVLKALSKETTRRYGSVEELAADLRRYLDGRPVEARPSTWSYRASKFVRRNRTAVVMGSVALLAVVAGAAFSLWSARVAERERATAERRLRDVTVMANTVLWDVNEGLATIPGATPLRAKVVDMATTYLNGIATEGVQDTALVRTLADAFEKLGTVQGAAWAANVGRSEEAYRSFKKSLALREELVRRDPTHAEYIVDLMSILNKIRNYDEEHGKPEEMLAMSARSLVLIARLKELKPDEPRYRINSPRMRHNHGLSLVAAGRVEEGVAELRRGLAEFQALADAEPAEASHKRALAQATIGYSEALALLPGAPDSSLAALSRARAILEPLVKASPDDVALRRRLGSVSYGTGRILLLRTRDTAGALREALASNAITAAATKGDPGNEDYAVSHAISRTLVGHALAANGRFDEAEATLRPLIPELERYARADTTDTRFPQELIEARLAMGIVEAGRAKRSAGAAGGAGGAAHPAVGAAADHWRRAEAWFEGAQSEHRRLIAKEPTANISQDELAIIASGLAECRKALGK